MSEIRSYVVNQLSTIFKVPKNEKICVNLEKCIFNWTVRRTKHLDDQPSWENSFFRERYKRKFLDIKFNMTDPTNGTLVEKIKSGEMHVTKVPSLSSCELNPSGVTSLCKERMRIKRLRREAINTEDPDYVGLFKCGKCKSNQTTYYQMQTRSADEPMTTFVTCINCSNRWRC